MKNIKPNKVFGLVMVLVLASMNFACQIHEQTGRANQSFT